MPLLSKNNHFKYFYNNIAFSFRQSAKDLFTTSHSPITRFPMSWKEECLNAAREIRETYSGELGVLFSGGLDSEVVVRSFHEAGVKINVYIMEFEGGLNQHDIQFAFDTCKELDINPRILKIDVLEFWKEDIWKYADKVQVASPQLATIIWAIDQIKDTLILGAGEGYFRRSEGSNVFYEMESEVAYSLYRWFIHSDRSGVPAFFQYNSELMLSFMLDQNVLNFVRDGKKRKFLSTNKIKHELYSAHFNLQYRIPQNGFEKLEEEDQQIRSEMKLRYPGATAIFKTNHYRYLNSFGSDLKEIIDPYFVNFESLEI